MVIRIKSSNFKLAPMIFSDLTRIGNQSDGGYVVPKSAIQDLDTLISFGIGSNWTFESDIEKLLPDIKIIGFDHTVSFAYFSRKSLKGFLKGIIKRDLLDHFNPRLNRLVKYIRFWIMKRNMNHLQIKITKENVERIISKYSNRSSFGIKIDIEGSEFEILPIVLDTLKLANFIIVEFHDIEINKVRFDYIIKTLSQFAVIAHLHCNNFDPVGLNGFPKTVELTFVNNKFSHNNKQRLELPLEYDYPNAKNRPDYSIVFA